MYKKPITLLVVLLGAILAAIAGEQSDPRGTWKSKLAMFGDTIRFDLRYDGGSTRLSLDENDLAGFSREDLKKTGASLRFSWTRDPGTLEFEGEGKWFGRPEGTFRVVPDPEFRAQLARIGIEQAGRADLFDLMLHDVRLTLVTTLANTGYDDVALADIERLTIHAVSARYVEGMQLLGYRPRPDELITLKNRGLGVDMAKRLDFLELKGIPVETLVRFRTYGIGPDFLRGMTDAGIPPDRADEIIRLRTHGIAPARVATMKHVEGFELTTDDLITLRNHGIDADYLQGLAQSGERLTIEQVTKLRTHGIPADTFGQFVELGYRKPAEVIELRIHGIPASTVGQLAKLGYDELEVDELVRLHVQGVSPAFVRELVEDGYQDLTVEQLVEIRIHGRDRLGSIANSA